MFIFFHGFLYVALCSACNITLWNPFEFKRLHVAALILARGGSKAIPMKNVAKFGNTTLLKNSLKVILQTEVFNSVWVSTDDRIIYKEALHGKVNIHWRSAQSASDNASSIFAVNEFLGHHQEVDAVALIQCTSPFIKVQYLQQGLSIFFSGIYECVFSVTISKKFRWDIINNTLVPLNFIPNKRERRQDFKGGFVENGMFYISTRKLIQKNYLQNER